MTLYVNNFKLTDGDTSNFVFHWCAKKVILIILINDLIAVCFIPIVALFILIKSCPKKFKSFYRSTNFSITNIYTILYYYRINVGTAAYCARMRIEGVKSVPFFTKFGDITNTINKTIHKGQGTVQRYS